MDLESLILNIEDISDFGLRHLDPDVQGVARRLNP